jgi:hypothetical protein
MGVHIHRSKPGKAFRHLISLRLNAEIIGIHFAFGIKNIFRLRSTFNRLGGGEIGGEEVAFMLSTILGHPQYQALPAPLCWLTFCLLRALFRSTGICVLLVAMTERLSCLVSFHGPF